MALAPVPCAPQQTHGHWYQTDLGCCVHCGQLHSRIVRCEGAAADGFPLSAFLSCNDRLAPGWGCRWIQRGHRIPLPRRPKHAAGQAGAAGQGAGQVGPMLLNSNAQAGTGQLHAQRAACTASVHPLPYLSTIEQAPTSSTRGPCAAAAATVLQDNKRALPCSSHGAGGCREGLSCQGVRS